MRRGGLAALLLVTLAGCGGGFSGGGGTSTGGFNALLPGRSAPSQATVTSAAVTIAGPDGFCVDPASTKDDGGTGFVLLSNCAAVTGSGAGVEGASRAVLTASVGQNPGDPVGLRLAETDAFLRSPQGLSTLSRSGDAGTVEILESFAQGETLFLRLRDSSDAGLPNLAPDHWRAILDVKSTLVTLSVMGIASEPMAPATGLSTMEAFVQRVRELNGMAEPAPVATLAPVAEPQQQQQQQQYQPQQQQQQQPQSQPILPSLLRSAPLGSIGLLRRLLG